MIPGIDSASFVLRVFVAVFMRKTVFLLTCVLLACAVAPPGNTGSARPVPFEKEGRWGYRNAGGGIVIRPRFKMADAFTPEGVAAVVDEKGWAYIDMKGEVILRPFVFDNGPDYFKENLARFVDGGKFGFFDRRGRVVIPAKFDFAAPFSEGLAAVCEGCAEVFEGEHRLRKGGKWGFIDRSGKLAIPARFDEAGRFKAGKAKVRLGKRWQYIGRDGAVTR